MATRGLHEVKLGRITVSIYDSRTISIDFQWPTGTRRANADIAAARKSIGLGLKLRAHSQSHAKKKVVFHVVEAEPERCKFL